MGSLIYRLFILYCKTFLDLDNINRNLGRKKAFEAGQLMTSLSEVSTSLLTFKLKDVKT